MDNLKKYKKFADVLNSKDIHQVYEVVSEMTFDELKEFVNKHEGDISMIDMDTNIYCYYQGIKDAIEASYR